MNTFKTCITWGLIACLALTLSGCGSKPKHDSAPKKKLNPHRIKDAKPKQEPYSKYGNPPTYKVMGKKYKVWKTHVGYKETGIASWYGTKFHKQLTSTREPYDMYAMTAAHKNLPIPSYVKVTNLENKKSIIVRVNDRGPFHGDRVIDLSYAAAVKLGYADRGTARVQLDAVVVTGPNSDTGLAQAPAVEPTLMLSANQGDKYLQVGAFADLSAAEAVSNRLRDLTRYPVFIRSVKSGTKGVLHRVRVGPIADAGEIEVTSERVVAANLGSPYTVTE